MFWFFSDSLVVGSLFFGSRYCGLNYCPEVLLIGFCFLAGCVFMDVVFNVRALELSDLPAVVDVQSRSWLATYPDVSAGVDEGFVQEVVSSFNVSFMQQLILNVQGDRFMFPKFVLDRDGIVVGFCYMSVFPDSVFLDAMYLDPNFTGFGFGGLLMKSVLSVAGFKPCFLHVASYNTNAIGFYKRFGFVETSKVLEHSRGRIPLLEMCRPSSVLNV